MKIKSDKSVLWDDLRVTIYGPWDLQDDEAACDAVENLMKRLPQAVRLCFEEQIKESRTLKSFRIEVEK
jgi:hypothetical protein